MGRAAKPTSNPKGGQNATAVEPPALLRSERWAAARATAAAILETQRPERVFDVDPERILRRSPRKRLHQRGPKGSYHVGAREARRRGSVLLLIGEVAALAVLLLLPPLRTGVVEVAGARLLNAPEITAAAQLNSSQSIFTLDGQAIRDHVEGLAWVRSASVATELPHTVRITVTERPPIFEVRSAGRRLVVAETGATLDLATHHVDGSVHLPVLVDERTADSHDLPPRLLQILAAAAAHFPGVYGCPLAGFDWEADGRLDVVAATGWRAYLGHENEDAQIDAIPTQLAALASLRAGPAAQLDFAHPQFGYIDLVNPQTPAVGGKPEAAGSFPPPLHAPGPSTAPSRAPSSAPGTVAPVPLTTPSPATPSLSPSTAPGPRQLVVPTPGR